MKIVCTSVDIATKHSEMYVTEKSKSRIQTNNDLITNYRFPIGYDRSKNN